MSNDEPTSLQDVARRALDKHEGVSGRQLDAIARDKGLKIVYTTINHMAAGTYKSRPGRPTLEALAELSGLPLEQVYAAARLPMPMKPFRDDIPDDADLLDGPQRRAVIDTIRLFAQQNKANAALRAELEGGGGRAGSPAPNTDRVIEDEPITPKDAGEPRARRRPAPPG